MSGQFFGVDKCPPSAAKYSLSNSFLFLSLTRVLTPIPTDPKSILPTKTSETTLDVKIPNNNNTKEDNLPKSTLHQPSIEPRHDLSGLNPVPSRHINVEDKSALWLQLTTLSTQAAFRASLDNNLPSAVDILNVASACIETCVGHSDNRCMMLKILKDAMTSILNGTNLEAFKSGKQFVRLGRSYVNSLLWLNLVLNCFVVIRED